MNTKHCKQCGELKPMEQFRNYYGGRKGTYTICKSCEKINSRTKYLEKKQSKSMSEEEELSKIYRLYDAQRACGLQPPRREGGRQVSLVDSLDDMIGAYTAQANAAAAIPSYLDPAFVPADIKGWFTTELTEDPDYYLDEVYETLKMKYRPILRVDKSTLLPVYDDTYKAALDALLSLFNAYEDKYYNDSLED